LVDDKNNAPEALSPEEQEAERIREANARAGFPLAKEFVAWTLPDGRVLSEVTGKWERLVGGAGGLTGESEPGARPN
jgi:hypothetical protein